MVLQGYSAAHGEQVVAEFSAKAADVVRRLGGDRHTICCVDADARAGSVVSDHIGDVDPQPEDMAGSFTHQFLRGVGAFLPSTQWGA